MTEDFSRHLDEWDAGNSDFTAREITELVSREVSNSSVDAESLDVYTKYMIDLDDMMSKGLISMDELELKVAHLQILKNNDPTGRSARKYLEVLTVLNLVDLHAKLDAVKLQDGYHDVFTNYRRRSLAYDIFSQAIVSEIGRPLIANGSKFYVRGHDGYRSLGTFNAKKFALFIFEAFNSVTGAERYMSTSDTRKLANLIEDKITEELEASNNIIQFRDCYILNAEVFQGSSPIFPRFFVERYVWDAVDRFNKTGQKPAHNRQTQTALNLMLHLCNYDGQTLKRFEAVVSMIFCNDRGLRSKYSKMIKLYGQTGANGKSLFHSILSNAVGSANSTSFYAKDFGDPFRVGRIARSLFALEAEDSGKINKDSAQMIKSLVTSDPIMVRDIRSEPTEVNPVTTLFSNTNLITKSQDKSDGFSRRIDWFEVKDKLYRRDPWFKSLRSDATAQFLCEYLLVTMLDIVRNDAMPEESDMMRRTYERFTNENNSTIEYIEAVGLQSIIGMSKSEVRANYEKWCEENDMVAYYDVFDSTISSKFHLESRRLNKSTVNPDSEYYSRIQSNARGAQVRGWVPNGISYINYDNLDEDGNVIFDFIDEDHTISTKSEKSSKKISLDDLEEFKPKLIRQSYEDSEILEETENNSNAEESEQSDSQIEHSTQTSRDHEKSDRDDRDNSSEDEDS